MNHEPRCALRDDHHGRRDDLPGGETFKVLRDVTEAEEWQRATGGEWRPGTHAAKSIWFGDVYVKVRPKRQPWVADGVRVSRGPVAIYVAYDSITPGGTACDRARRLADLLNREDFE